MSAVAGAIHRSRGLGLRESFEKRVQRGASEDDCWTWIGHIGTNGYGTMATKAGGKARQAAHRVSYALHRGEIPEGLVVMHSCDNRRCVNPRHLSIGTSRANTLDMMAKERHASFRQTHCANGHEFTEANTILRGPEDKRRRVCKTCNAARCAANRRAEDRVVTAVVAMLRAEAMTYGDAGRVEAVRATVGMVERGCWRSYPPQDPTR